VNYARYLYDSFVPFTPIFSALSQATPIFKGKLSDHDFRHQVIEKSVDCRTVEERDPDHLNYLAKSNYSPVSHYLSNHEYTRDELNDT
jgi:glutamate--cysteine ligase catalytic subunit